MKHVVKKGGIFALALALLLALPALPGAFAAGAVDTAKKCSVTFRLEGMEAEYTELGQMEIPIKMYRVADMDATGNYAVLEGFEGLDFSGINSATSAKDWQQMAQTAIDAVEKEDMQPDGETALNGAGEDDGIVGGLAAGMYLVRAETVQSPEYSYAFAPYLLSLPNNYFYQTQDDAWVYDVTSELKPDQTERYGSLEIVKQLGSYNQSLGNAYFVFRVEATRGSQNVYSNAFALDFNAPGEKKLLIEHIPAGTQVTVTEVYSGASYEASGDSVRQTAIIAEGETGGPASVTFRNEYNNHRNTGTGIVNRFTYQDGTWDVEQQADSAGLQ